MSHYCSSTIISIILVLVISLTYAWASPSFTKDKLILKKNDTSLNIYQRISAQARKVRNITSSGRGRFKPVHEWDEDHDNDQIEQHEDDDTSLKQQTADVVVLTSLSGIYVWWPILFGGDDSFHLLLSQEDVPRFHDVTGDENGNIYLTAPHERTVYRLQYSDGWWIANFSNHSLMNSIRSEMPLFVNIHRVSSILYVYGHSDIQVIDLLERPRTRGSAPFMKRLRELSPNLRISDLIIDQLTSEGYIIGDSYGWCIVIRCSLSVNECAFLFKIPTSYDNRPYPCTATIDFSNKILYLSLEEKVLGVHLNEQTNYDRRFVVTEKNGPRSTLGYDDIATYNNTILYTDVLRPVLHICTSKNSNPCLNLSLVFAHPHRTILPLRLSIIRVQNLRPPVLDEDDDFELHLNQTDSPPAPAPLMAKNTTQDYQPLMVDKTTTTPHDSQPISLTSLWMLLLGTLVGLIIGALSFMIYSIVSKKNQRTIMKETLSTIDRIESSTVDRKTKNGTKTKISAQSSSDSATNHLLESSPYSSSNSSSEWTTVTTSSLSYQPDIIL